MNEQLLPHQEKELAFLRERNRVLLASEMGCGKTPVMLTRAYDTLDAGGTVLWITTKSLGKQLVTEAERWIERSPIAFDKADRGDRFLWITHESVHKRAEALALRAPFDYVIVDEASKLGGLGENPSAPVAAGIRDALHAAKASVVATGTPLNSAHGLDLWAVAEAAGIPVMARDEYEAGVKWETVQAGRWPKRVAAGVEWQTFQTLVHQIRPWLIRHTLTDLEAALPDVEIQHHWVELSPTAAQAYEQADRISDSLRWHQQTQAASRDTALVDEALRIVQQHKTDSIVLFSEQFDLLDHLADRLTDAGVGFARITGNETAKQRAEAQAAFTDGAVRLLLVTGAGEYGLNAQTGSRLVTVAQTWSPAREAQRLGRIRRVGSQHIVVTHHVVSPKVALEDRKQRRLAKKEALTDLLWVLTDGAEPSCIHGLRVHRSGVAASGRTWEALFCPGRWGQCEPIWL
jgi:superfamily II DNA or RNA helicase